MAREIKFRAWDGDDSISHKDGEYIYVKAEWHPYANKRGYVKRHRLVLEKKLGYYIPKRSIVHHKDENKRNDHPDNLELLPNQSLHSKSHDSGLRNDNGQFVSADPIFNEIKFRLFNKHTQQYEFYNLSKLIRTTFRNSQFNFAGRYTGLKDKNGVEIYEGDIVKAENWNTKVFHTEFILAPVVFSYGQYWLQTPAGLHSLYDTNGEVIGNIYQNPELLNTKL